MARETWDDVYTKKGFSGTWYPNEEVIRFTARYLKRRVGIEGWDVKRDVRRVLDVGCGNGRHVVFFAKQGFEVYGIDISKEAIEIGGAWLFEKGLKAYLRVGNIEKLPFDVESFDVVISDGVLDHIPFSKAKKVMKEIRRVCAPNGYIYITLRSTEDSEFGRGEEVTHNTFVLRKGYERDMIQHYFNLDEVTELLEGFKVFDIELNEERFLDVFTVDKAFLQSSEGVKRYIDLSKSIDMNLKYSRWYIAAEKS
jgi:SAM-dependent methyltransferase